MYPGLCFYSGMVRPTDQETTATESTVCRSQFPKRDMPHNVGPKGEAPGSVRRQKE